MTVYELARKYYPRLWGKDRLKALAGAGRLSPKEYKALTGEAYRGE